MSDLQTLHAELLEMLDTLEELTARPQLNEAAVTSVRYRLTRVSAARRKLVDALCIDLQERASPSQAVALRALREAASAAKAASSDHITTWSLREMLRDWLGYCRASAAMRRSMRDQIEAEKAAIYPLL
jgi:hypothetical protein